MDKNFEKLVENNLIKYLLGGKIKEFSKDFSNKSYYHILTEPILQKLDDIVPEEEGKVYNREKSQIGKYVFISLFGEPVEENNFMEIPLENDRLCDGVNYCTERSQLDLMKDLKSDMDYNLLSSSSLHDLVILTFLQKKNKSL